MDWNLLFTPANLALLVPIMWPVWMIVSTITSHRERMAMIEKGMDPDAAKRREKERMAMIKQGMNPDALAPAQPPSALDQVRR